MNWFTRWFKKAPPYREPELSPNARAMLREEWEAGRPAREARDRAISRSVDCDILVGAVIAATAIAPFGDE